MNIIANYLRRVPVLLEHDILSINPNRIICHTITSGKRKYFISLVIERRNRKNIKTNPRQEICPLCNDALRKGNMNEHLDGWTVTVNRFPGLQNELLIVKSKHTDLFDINDLLALSYVAERFKVKILYSSGVNSIASHKHGCITNERLPLQDGNTIEITKNISVTLDYPASIYLIKGELNSRVDVVNDIINKLLERQVEYNLIIFPNHIYIHPIKNIKPRNLKKIGPREVAGCFSTSRKNFFEKIRNNPQLIPALLSESSYSLTELKCILSNNIYSYDDFSKDSKNLARQVRNYCQKNKCKVDHIVGVTRGGIALASIMMSELGCDSISLTGCYFEKTKTNEDIIHWKTPMSRFKGRVVLVTSDLIRSGKILKNVIDKIHKVNSEIETVILVAHHLFEGGKIEMFPYFVSHVLSSDNFVTYPWECEIDRSNDEHYNSPCSEITNWAIRISKEIIELTRKVNQKVTEIIGFGDIGIMGVAIFSQNLGVRNVYGYNESVFKLSRTYRHKYIQDIVSGIPKQESIRNAIMISLNFIDSTNIVVLKEIIDSLKRFTRKEVYVVGFDVVNECPEVLTRDNIPKQLSTILRKKKNSTA